MSALTSWVFFTVQTALLSVVIAFYVSNHSPVTLAVAIFGGCGALWTLVKR